MKELLSGLPLALQFFSSIPVKATLPMTKRSITSMFAVFPFIGLLEGTLLFGLYTLLSNELHIVLLAALLVAAHLAFTGGLHLDGLTDTADAYFSYKDQAKRQEILKDPRVGAFGAMTVGVSLLMRFGIYVQLISLDLSILYWLVIPILIRCGMVLYLVGTNPSKEHGMAHFFRQHFSFLPLTFIQLFILATLIVLLPVSSGPVAVLFIGIWYFKTWTRKHFGGASGDMCGAFIEGGELVVWLVLLILL